MTSTPEFEPPFDGDIEREAADFMAMKWPAEDYRREPVSSAPSLRVSSDGKFVAVLTPSGWVVWRTDSPRVQAVRVGEAEVADWLPLVPAVSPAPDTEALRAYLRRTIGADFERRLIAAALLDDDDALSVLRVFEDVVPAIERESTSRHEAFVLMLADAKSERDERIAGLRADLDRARADLAQAVQMVKVCVGHPDTGLEPHAELIRKARAGARTIPDDAAVLEVIDERDNAEEWADRLAYAIAPVEVIGEHSSTNNPWQRALDVLADLGATPTTGPAPAAADGLARLLWGLALTEERFVSEFGTGPSEARDALHEVMRQASAMAAAPQAPAEPTGSCPRCHCAEPIHKTWCTEIDGAATPGCPCFACAPAGGMRVMNLCPTCGNKRCPGAANHRNTCTGSNKPGQPGSLYENEVSPTDLVGPAAREDTATPDGHQVNVIPWPEEGPDFWTADCTACPVGYGGTEQETNDWADRHRADTLRPSGPLAPIRHEEE